MRFLLLLLPLVILTACGGSRNRPYSVERCKEDFMTAHKMSVDGHKSVDLDAPNGEIASANLAFVSANLYIYDKARDIRIHITQNKTEAGGTNDYKEYCFGGTGINRGMKPFVLTIPVFDQVDIDKSGKTNFATGTITLDLRYRSEGTWLQTSYDAPSGGKDKSGSLKKVYESYKNVNQLYFYGESQQIRNSMSAEVSDTRNSSKSEVEIKTTQSFKSVDSE